jgi:hypothetical protein
MASIILQYQKQFASVTNGTFEVSKGNWADHGSHAITRTTTAAQVRTGIGASKIIAGGAGDYATNNVSLDATYMPAVLLANTYKIRLYALASAATPSLTIACAGTQAGTATELNSTTWTKCELTFAAAAADVSTHIIKLWASGAATIYIDDIQIIEYSTFANALSVYGADEPDAIETYPNLMEKVLDGSYYRQPPKVFNRMISVDLGVVSTKAQRVFLANFAWQATYSSIIYATEEIEVVIPDLAQFSNTRLDECEYGRSYFIELIEKTGRSTNPSTW